MAKNLKGRKRSIRSHQSRKRKTILGRGRVSRVMWISIRVHDVVTEETYRAFMRDLSGKALCSGLLHGRNFTPVVYGIAPKSYSLFGKLSDDQYKGYPVSVLINGQRFPYLIKEKRNVAVGDKPGLKFVLEAPGNIEYLAAVRSKRRVLAQPLEQQKKDLAVSLTRQTGRKLARRKPARKISHKTWGRRNKPNWDIYD